MAYKFNERREIDHGIYIDFEGTQKEPPAMLGAYWVTPDGQEHLVQLVFDARLKSAVIAKNTQQSEALCMAVDSLEHAFEIVLNHSERLNVPLIAWSCREQDVLDSSALPDSLKVRLRERMKNALPFCRTWVRKNYGSNYLPKDKRGNRNTLTNFASLTEFNIPKIFGSGNSASRLREVIRQISKRGSYEKITPVAKAKWSKFLKHNEYDLKATRHVLEHIFRSKQTRGYHYFKSVA